MKLQDARIRVTTETAEQFRAALETGAAGLIYLDAGYLTPGEMAKCVREAHSRGVLCGLRLPQIWRERTERYYAAEGQKILEAGFDLLLYRCMEEAFYWAELGYTGPYALDHTIYATNAAAVRMLTAMLPDGGAALHSAALSLELNAGELAGVSEAWGRIGKGGRAESGDGNGIESGDGSSTESGIGTELTVYGRAPMMVTAQCPRKTTLGCAAGAAGSAADTLMYLEDRTGARMPVRNCCRFCTNTIYNAVPLMLCDLPEEIRRTGARYLRYEFTSESAAEVRELLAMRPGGDIALPPGAFTRGHFRKSVM